MQNEVEMKKKGTYPLKNECSKYFFFANGRAYLPFRG